MLLLLMRHAKSDWNQPGLDDFSRPLNDRGRKSAPRMANWLADSQRMPNIICCSTAVRAKQTCELLIRTWSEKDLVLPEIVWYESMYLATPHVLLQCASEHTQSPTVMLIAHNPGMEVLASDLSGQEIEMPTAAVVCFESEQSITDTASFASTRWRMVNRAIPRQFES